MSKRRIKAQDEPNEHDSTTILEDDANTSPNKRARNDQDDNNDNVDIHRSKRRSARNRREAEDDDFEEPEEEIQQQEEQLEQQEAEEMMMMEEEEEEEPENPAPESEVVNRTSIRSINAAGKVPEAGIILKVYVENFMCHRKLTIALCKNVNFIHGQNGSGKSAILGEMTAFSFDLNSKFWNWLEHIILYLYFVLIQIYVTNSLKSITHDVVYH